MLLANTHYLTKIHKIQYVKQSTRIKRNNNVCVRCSYSCIPAILGSLAAFTTTYPLDTYKTFIQNDKSSKHINIKRGFKGYSPGLILCCITSTIYFFIFTKISQHLPLLPASIISTFCSSLVKVPGKTITKLLQNGDFPNVQKATSFMFNKYGVNGFYRGFIPYIMNNVPETSLKFYFYNLLKNMYPNNSFIVGALTGLVVSIITQPLDVLQTKVMCNVSSTKLNYKKINYFSGICMSLLINSVQTCVFFHVHHIAKELKVLSI